MIGTSYTARRTDQLTTVRSDHLCECGCGEYTFISPRTRADRRWVKGQPRRFLAGHNLPRGTIHLGPDFPLSPEALARRERVEVALRNALYEVKYDPILGNVHNSITDALRELEGGA